MAMDVCMMMNPPMGKSVVDYTPVRLFLFSINLI
jgi:hypothetical protein